MHSAQIHLGISSLLFFPPPTHYQGFLFAVIFDENRHAAIFLIDASS